MTLKVGDAAPDFKLASTAGGDVTLASLKGKKTVLYFYPRDSTPGCTVEACDFRDNLARATKAGAAVYGVSKDTLASHAKFQTAQKLNFPLLSDPDNAAAKAYGAFGEKTLYGKKSMGTIRSTFLIDEAGKLAAVWSGVKVKGHVDQVIAAISGEAPAAAKPAKKPAAKKAAKPAAKATTKASPAKKAAKKK